MPWQPGGAAWCGRAGQARGTTACAVRPGPGREHGVAALAARTRVTQDARAVLVPAEQRRARRRSAVNGDASRSLASSGYGSAITAGSARAARSASSGVPRRQRSTTASSGIGTPTGFEAVARRSTPVRSGTALGEVSSELMVAPGPRGSRVGRGLDRSHAARCLPGWPRRRCRSFRDRPAWRPPRPTDSSVQPRSGWIVSRGRSNAGARDV